MCVFIKEIVTTNQSMVSFCNVLVNVPDHAIRFVAKIFYRYKNVI